MTSKLVEIGLRVLELSKEAPSEEEGQIYQILVNAEQHNAQVPDEVRFNDDFLFVEETASRLNFPVSPALVYMVHIMSGGDKDLVLLLWSAVKALAHSNRRSQQGVTCFFEHFLGHVPSKKELVSLSMNPSTMAYLRKPEIWSV